MSRSEPAQLALDLPPPSRKAPIPATGVIRGGARDGWTYALIAIRTVNGRKLPYVRAGEPGWPFPREILIRPPARLEPAA